MASSAVPATVTRQQLTRAVVASTIGTSIEWYDFFLYGSAAALVLNSQFFPNVDPSSGVLLAFGARGNPVVVMSIVFAGAPIVNAIYSIIQHPPAGGWGSIKPQFYLGILLAAAGGCLVTFYKPAVAPAGKPAAHVMPASPRKA